MLSLIESFELLKKYKINVAPYSIVYNVDDAIYKSESIGYPVVLKAISHKISHKTEYGIVRTNLISAEDIKDAWNAIIRRLTFQRIPFEGMIVQKQMTGHELIIGGKRDEQFGQMIIFGLGGIYVEVFKDISVRICPINKQDAHEMINEIKAHPIIAGFRGSKPVNENALVDTLLKTCKLLQKEDPVEMDLNPLFANDKECAVVDARIIFDK